MFKKLVSVFLIASCSLASAQTLPTAPRFTTPSTGTNDTMAATTGFVARDFVSKAAPTLPSFTTPGVLVNNGSGVVSSTTSPAVNVITDIAGADLAMNAGYVTVNSRSLFTSIVGTPVNWMGTFSYGVICEICALSGVGDTGLVGATRTDLYGSSGLGKQPIGVAGWSFNFNTTYANPSWATYSESRRKTGAGVAIGHEIEVTELNSSDVPQVNSYNSSNSSSIALQVGSGGSCGVGTGLALCYDGSSLAGTAVTAGVAINVIANPVGFYRGLVFAHDAIAGADGTGGSNIGAAINLARGHMIAWDQNSTTFLKSRLWSDLSAAGNGIYLKYTDYGFHVENTTGDTALQIKAVDGNHSGVSIEQGSGTNPAQVSGIGNTQSALHIIGGTAANSYLTLQSANNGAPSGDIIYFVQNGGVAASITGAKVFTANTLMTTSLTLPALTTPGILTNNSSGAVSSSNAITLNQTHSGSAPLANWSSITIPIDTVTPCDFCTDFNITHHIQSLVRGARSSGFNWIIQDNAPTSGSNVTVLVGATLIGQSNAGDGGTATTNAGARGTYFGANTIARNAGPNIISVVGIESDIQTTAASSSRYTFGYSAVNYEAAQSAALDTAFAIYSGGSIDASGGSGPWGPGIGFHCGICFSEISANGLVPLDAGATVLGTHLESLGTIPAGIGIDLTGFTFSGAAYKSNLFTVTQGGSIFAQAYWANGSQGVTKVCTVLPTVVGGIITAC